jgi:hypothetical protein
MSSQFPKAHSSPCCKDNLLPTTKSIRDGRVVWRWKRCLVCGFTVREILSHDHDYDTEYSELRTTMRKLGTRGMFGGWYGSHACLGIVQRHTLSRHGAE